MLFLLPGIFAKYRKALEIIFCVFRKKISKYFSMFILFFVIKRMSYSISKYMLTVESFQSFLRVAYTYTHIPMLYIPSALSK